MAVSCAAAVPVARGPRVALWMRLLGNDLSTSHEAQAIQGSQRQEARTP